MELHFADIPEPPIFSQELIQNSKSKNDYMEMLFEYYKYFSLLTSFFAGIKLSSVLFKSIPENEHLILIGLLQRCARLMISNLKLSTEGKNRETIGIIDRCIIESVIKVCWLIRSDIPDKFDRYIADGFKADIEMKKEIERQIEERGSKLILDEKLLNTINKIIINSGFTVEQLEAIKKLPDIATMTQNIVPNRIMYIVEYKLGSHYIHGTWNDVMANYIVKINGEFFPRLISRDVSELQYLHTIAYVLEALDAFFWYMIKDNEILEKIRSIPKTVYKHVDNIFSSLYDKEFEDVSKS